MERTKHYDKTTDMKPEDKKPEINDNDLRRLKLCAFKERLEAELSDLASELSAVNTRLSTLNTDLASINSDLSAINEMIEELIPPSTDVPDVPDVPDVLHTTGLTKLPEKWTVLVISINDFEKLSRGQ